MNKLFVSRLFTIIAILIFTNVNNVFSQDTLINILYDLDSNLYKRTEIINGLKTDSYYDISGNRIDSIYTVSMNEESKFIDIRKVVAKAIVIPKGLYAKNEKDFEIFFSVIIEIDGSFTNFRLLSGFYNEFKQKEILAYHPKFELIKPFYQNGIPIRCELVGSFVIANLLPILRETKTLEYKIKN